MVTMNEQLPPRLVLSAVKVTVEVPIGNEVPGAGA